MLLHILLAAALAAQTPDTLACASLTAERGITVSRNDTLKIENGRTVTDVLLQSPGLVVADYGGLAGLKSVNLRGLGSPCTSVTIDGIKVGNVQSGQMDLSNLGLENYGAATVDYAQNSVNFSTVKPVFGENPVAGRIRMNTGSFGTYVPSARLDFRLSERLSASANAAFASSRGDFSCGDGINRANNDAKQLRGGIDLFGLADKGDWSVKAWCGSSERGTPGSLDWPSSDRQKDSNALLQGILRKHFSPRYSLVASTKASYDDVLYSSEWGDSRYGQTELQLNTAHMFHVTRALDLSATAELCWDGLESTSYDARRLSVSAAAGAALKLERLKAEATLELLDVWDSGASAESYGSRRALSPALSLRYRLCKSLDLSGFARRSWRTPTFNELYYPGYGNPALHPEDALLADLGFDWRRAVGDCWNLKAKLDGFCARLEDKIVSAPSPDDPSLWLPYNIAEVRSAGFDAVAGASYSSEPWRAAFDARYSLQAASAVPYLSKHTVVCTADAACKTWSLRLGWNWRGGRRDAAGPMPSWNALDLSLAKTFRLRGSGTLALQATVRNLGDCRYQLVSGYPLPGRNAMFGLEYKF